MIGAVRIFKTRQQNALFLRKFQPVMIVVKIFKSLQQNALFLQKYQVVIIGGVQIFKTLQQKLHF